MANYPFENMVAPYFEGVLSKVKRSVNFFNEVDYALNSWKYNNAYRPDSLYGFGYTGSTNALEYLNGNGQFFRDPPLPLNRETLTLFPNETRRYQIFAYCAESRSVALGQVTALPSGFTEKWNLGTTMGYNNHHYSHSREFRSSVVAEWLYWSKVFEIIAGQNNP